MSTPLVSPTVQAMLQSIRNMLNQPDPNNSYWTDSELLEYINEAIRVYFAEYSATNEGNFTTTASLDITSGTRTIALPSDFFKVKALYRVTTGENVLLEYKNNLSRSYATTGSATGSGYTPAYYFQGNNIVLHDTPGFSEVGGLFLEYLQFPETMLNGSDTLTAQISPIFRQIVERYALYLAKLKESLGNGTVIPTSLTQNLADLVAQFREIIQLRSKNPTYAQAFDP